MPGKRVTDHQVIKYKQYQQQLGQEAAAARVGISELPESSTSYLPPKRGSLRSSHCSIVEALICCWLGDCTAASSMSRWCARYEDKMARRANPLGSLHTSHCRSRIIAARRQVIGWPFKRIG